MQCALKVEKDPESSRLASEIKVLHRVQGKRQLCQVLGSGTHGGRCVGARQLQLLS